MKNSIQIYKLNALLSAWFGLVAQDANNCDGEIRELREAQQELSQQLEDKQVTVQQLQGAADTTDGDLERLIELKHKVCMPHPAPMWKLYTCSFDYLGSRLSYCMWISYLIRNLCSFRIYLTFLSFNDWIGWRCWWIKLSSRLFLYSRLVLSGLHWESSTTMA